MAKKKAAAEPVETQAQLLVQVNEQLGVLDRVKNDLPLANIQEARKKLAVLQEQFAVIEKQLEVDENTKWLKEFTDEYKDRYWMYEWTNNVYFRRSVVRMFDFKLTFNTDKRRSVSYSRHEVVCGIYNPAATNRKRSRSYGELLGFHQHVNNYDHADNIYDLARNRVAETTKEVFEHFLEMAADDGDRWYTAIGKAVAEGGINPTVVAVNNDQRKLVLT